MQQQQPVIDIASQVPVGNDNRPYTFGGRPTFETPWPFTLRQYGRLLVMRSKVEAGEVKQ